MLEKELEFLFQKGREECLIMLNRQNSLTPFKIQDYEGDAPIIEALKMHGHQQVIEIDGAWFSPSEVWAVLRVNAFRCGLSLTNQSYLSPMMLNFTDMAKGLAEVARRLPLASNKNLYLVRFPTCGLGLYYDEALMDELFNELSVDDRVLYSLPTLEEIDQQLDTKGSVIILSPKGDIKIEDCSDEGTPTQMKLLREGFAKETLEPLYLMDLLGGGGMGAYFGSDLEQVLSDVLDRSPLRFPSMSMIEKFLKDNDTFWFNLKAVNEQPEFDGTIELASPSVVSMLKEFFAAEVTQ